MLRAEKRKMHEQLQKIITLKNSVFPDYKLQERLENFIGYYAQYGAEHLNILYNNIDPLLSHFLVVAEQ
jgi:uncharacterized protein YllA (UPF0747 family)